jgi:hypothetical protein
MRRGRSSSRREVIRLHELINHPELEDFDRGVPLECAAHQVERWGEAHDRSKSAENWYLARRIPRRQSAALDGDRAKAPQRRCGTVKRTRGAPDEAARATISRPSSPPTTRTEGESTVSKPRARPRRTCDRARIAATSRSTRNDGRSLSSPPARGLQLVREYADVVLSGKDDNRPASSSCGGICAGAIAPGR